jgi:hypothetical protein
VPDAPVSLLNNPTITSDTTIRFTWSAGASDGGSPVLDYNVWYDQASDSFIELATLVTNTNY